MSDMIQETPAVDENVSAGEQRLLEVKARVFDLAERNEELVGIIQSEREQIQAFVSKLVDATGMQVGEQVLLQDVVDAVTALAPEPVFEDIVK